MEFLEQLKNFIRPELLILVPVLYFIGCGLKRTESIADKKIPMLLGLTGVSLAAVWVAATTAFSGYRDALMAVFAAVTQGVLCAGASVYVSQLIIQNRKGE
nr:MAG TPA: holin [Caudoviricetes sp.]